MNVTVRPPLPEELVASSTFLLKRLGFTAKERGMQAYENEGLRPYHHAILIALGEGSHETQGAIADALEDDFLEPLSDAERAKLHALLLKLAAKHEPRCAPIPTS